MKKAKLIIGLTCLTILIVCIAFFCFGELFGGVKEIDVRGCEYIWKVFNTPDALHITDSSKRPGHVIYGTSNDMALKALKLPDIRIECLSDVEIITK